jgi:hypothetical protein
MIKPAPDFFEGRFVFQGRAHHSGYIRFGNQLIPLDRVMAQHFTKGNFVSMTLDAIALVLVISGAVVGLAAGFIAVRYRN